MKTNDPDLPLGRHVLQTHDGICPKITVLVLDRIGGGGDVNKLLRQQELRWISNLNATLPSGLNEAFTLKPFLRGFSSGTFDEDL